MTSASFVCFGEILWDILPNEEVPGGAPMNVAYHLQQLGNTPAIITQIGNDEKGKRLLQLLQAQQIDTRYVLTTADYPTGLVNAIPQPNGDMRYTIMQRVAWDFIPYREELAAVVKEAAYFIFGSLVARSEVSANTLQQLLNVAQTKVLDINLRAPHYTAESLTILLKAADILKLNEEELVLITDWLGSFDSLEARTVYLHDHFGLQLVIVTKGAAGAMVYTAGKFYYQEGIKVQVVDTIGSGDSFLAAFMTKYAAGSNIPEALSFATKLGAFVASSKGAWPIYKPGDL
jgi:fructokinase